MRRFGHRTEPARDRRLWLPALPLLALPLLAPAAGAGTAIGDPN
jgi:hypothetical protein